MQKQSLYRHIQVAYGPPLVATCLRVLSRTNNLGRHYKRVHPSFMDDLGDIMMGLSGGAPNGSCEGRRIEVEGRCWGAGACQPSNMPQHTAPAMLSRCPEGQGPPETTPQVQAPCPHGPVGTEPPPPAVNQPLDIIPPTEGVAVKHTTEEPMLPLFLHDNDLPALGKEVVLSPAASLDLLDFTANSNARRYPYGMVTRATGRGGTDIVRRSQQWRRKPQKRMLFKYHHCWGICRQETEHFFAGDSTTGKNHQGYRNLLYWKTQQSNP